MRMIQEPSWVHIDKNRLRAGQPAVTTYTKRRIVVCESVELGPGASIRTLPEFVFDDGPNVVVFTPYGLTVLGDATQRAHTKEMHATHWHKRGFELGGYRL